jgi:deferrochelatase/peroxidase EfeB
MTGPDQPDQPDAGPAGTAAANPAAVSRRRVLGMAGVGAVGLTAGGLGYGARMATAGERAAPALLPAKVPAPPVTEIRGLPVPFFGEHQAGISTPVQDRLHFTAFDVLTEDRDRVITLLKEWTAAAARMTAGLDAVELGAFPSVVEAPPGDTGEAVGLPPSRLTLTIGFGPTFFERNGQPRFGLDGRRPAALADIPHFKGDTLDPGRSGGDLVVQACADDPQVAVHAIRNLARIGFGTTSVRWSQLGFGKTSSTTPDSQTPRNLFGFKDGTNNIGAAETDRLNQHVWVGAADEPAWMRGGSYLVARRIRMLVETWDRTPLFDQEDIIGRDKREGAPLGLGSGAKERDKVVIDKLPEVSHVRLVSPDANDGATMLRRGYSFVDGSDGLGRLDVGLFFLAFMKDPRVQFVPIQRKMSAQDVMNEYIRHTGSGVWACPPGVPAPGGWWGQTLFA